jgi:phospholipase C
MIDPIAMTAASIAASAKTDGIKHVVLLLLENHSFDQMLGALQQVVPEVDGVTPALAVTRSNLTLAGTAIYQHETSERQMAFDPRHEHVNAMAQIKDHNSGFVSDFQNAYKNQLSQADLQDVMGYYPLDFLPALHRLGREFTICDRWFASLPGPTWPNRFFALSGTCAGQPLMPSGAAMLQLHWYTEQTQPTIFSRMTEREVPWRIYHYDFPCSLVLTQQRQPGNLAHYSAINDFFSDAAGKESDFPAFTFIEPQYFGVSQNDDHPPHNVMKAEKLIADVYNAIRSNPDLWESTLMIVAYDEHGGFYDHVDPPPTIAPDEKTANWSFNQLGVRVPALLISPRCKQRVEHTQFDHTSVLRYLQDKWSLGPLGQRALRANSIGCAVSANALLRQDTTPFIRVSNADLISDDVEAEKNATNANQDALHNFAEYLYQEADVGMEHAVDLAADAAKFANWWVSSTHWCGRQLTKLGAWFSSGMRKAQHDRLARTRNAFTHLKEARGVKTPGFHATDSKID